MTITLALVNMNSDPVGIPVLEESDIIELMYQEKALGELFTYDTALVDAVKTATQNLSLNLPFKLSIHRLRSVDEMTDNWQLPDEYQNINIEEWFADRIETHDQAVRVADELALYQQGGLYPLLRFLIYVVDLMREHKIVWGVGRGSSVSSYCLFLIGIHKIDSMKYNLDIKEFLK